MKKGRTAAENLPRNLLVTYLITLMDAIDEKNMSMQKSNLEGLKGACHI
jgi:hypothetical protein